MSASHKGRRSRLHAADPFHVPAASFLCLLLLLLLLGLCCLVWNPPPALVIAVCVLGLGLCIPFFAPSQRFVSQAWKPIHARLQRMQAQPFDFAIGTPTTVSQALVAIIDRYEEAYENEYTAQLLQKQAELDSLQSQINPHFLYNTLESIRGQAIEDGSPQTAEMLEVLSKLFQYTISRRGGLFALDQELKSVDNYLRIQQYRFGNRFSVIKAYDENDLQLLSHKIPKLSLQPIVENALYHGLESLTRPGTLEIGITRTQSRLIIHITDDGIGMPPEAVHAMNEKLRTYTYKAETRGTGGRHAGVAVANVNARLKLLYGQEYGIIVFSTTGVGTRVELSMPLLEA